MTVRRMSASVQDDGTIVVLNHTNIRESLRNDQSVSQAVKSYKEEYGPLDLDPGTAADRLSQNESLVLVQRSKDDSVCIVCAMTRESVAWTDDTSANELSELGRGAAVAACRRVGSCASSWRAVAFWPSAGAFGIEMLSGERWVRHVCGGPLVFFLHFEILN